MHCATFTTVLHFSCTYVQSERFTNLVEIVTYLYMYACMHSNAVCNYIVSELLGKHQQCASVFGKRHHWYSVLDRLSMWCGYSLSHRHFPHLCRLPYPPSTCTRWDRCTQRSLHCWDSHRCTAEQQEWSTRPHLSGRGREKSHDFPNTKLEWNIVELPLFKMQSLGYVHRNFRFTHIHPKYVHMYTHTAYIRTYVNRYVCMYAVRYTYGECIMHKACVRLTHRYVCTYVHVPVTQQCHILYIYTVYTVYYTVYTVYS